MKKVFLVVIILLLATFYSISSNQVPETKTTNLQISQPKKAPPPSKTVSASVAQKISSADSNEVTVDSRTDEEKRISEEVHREFLELIVPTNLPKDKAERYTLTYRSYLKSSYYLNEVVADHIQTNREDLAKAFRLLLLYSKDNNASDISHVLNLLEEEQPQVFNEALKEISSESELLLKRIQKQDPEFLEEQ